MHDAAVAAGMPRGCIVLVDSADRDGADALMQLHGVVDVLVPRGGAGLIRHCVEHAKVPVIETGTGNCHVYVHESADAAKARAIVLNAKCRRFGVCNAAETLLVDRAAARGFLPEAMVALAGEGVALHCDDEARRCAEWAAGEAGRTGVELRFDHADGGRLGHRVPGARAGRAGAWTAWTRPSTHVNRYGTRHSEAIVADPATPDGAAAIEAFLARVDAAAVYANASTAFTDGGQFGLGAEIGISTQKLHARGPFALAALTSYKYVLRGSGQVRA